MKEKPYDWKASVDENVRMGFVELMILQILTESDAYCYEMKKAIIERTGGVFSFAESSLYIPLIRMTDRGLISSRRETVTGKRFRTYYHIEAPGREYLAYGKAQCALVFGAVSDLLSGKKEDDNHD